MFFEGVENTLENLLSLLTFLCEFVCVGRLGNLFFISYYEILFITYFHFHFLWHHSALQGPTRASLSYFPLKNPDLQLVPEDQ